MLVAVYEKESTSCLALHRTLTWLLTLAHNLRQFTCKTNVYVKIWRILYLVIKYEEIVFE